MKGYHCLDTTTIITTHVVFKTLGIQDLPVSQATCWIEACRYIARPGQPAFLVSQMIIPIHSSTVPTDLYLPDLREASALQGCPFLVEI